MDLLYLFSHTLDDQTVDGRSLTVDMGDNGVFTFAGIDGSSVLGAKDDTTPTVGEEAWDDVNWCNTCTWWSI
jgi:hypothetical protein